MIIDEETDEAIQGNDKGSCQKRKNVENESVITAPSCSLVLRVVLFEVMVASHIRAIEPESSGCL
jgi:hypothetical protein